MSWLSGTIIPLLKVPSLDKTQLSSYRLITLSSLYGKIVDTLILNRYSDIFQSSAMQFVFKKNHSTNHCSFVIKEVVSYYLHNNFDVFACDIDMQKAFDRVALLKLFNKATSTNLPPFKTRFLFILYSNLSLRVSWNGAISDSSI